MIVALDGPAGSGKSTTARRVAERLGWLYLDTGAMYRAVGLAFRERGLPFTERAAERLVPGLAVVLEPDPQGTRVLLNGRDVTEAVRSPEATADASRASALGPVRAALVEAQRAVAKAQAEAGRGVVVEGRDIGTVVFPEAPVKFFVVADLDARAARRHAELARAGSVVPLDAVRADLAERDARDEGRPLAPLRPAPDARLLDTTRLGIGEQVEEVLAAVRRLREAAPS